MSNPVLLILHPPHSKLLKPSQGRKAECEVSPVANQACDSASSQGPASKLAVYLYDV